MIDTWTLEELKKETDIFPITYKRKMRFISVDTLWCWIEKNKHIPKDKMMNKLVSEIPI